jgi:hypothetical protein
MGDVLLAVFLASMLLAVFAIATHIYVLVALRRHGVRPQSAWAGMPTHALQLCRELPPSPERHRLVRLAKSSVMAFLIAMVGGGITGPMLGSIDDPCDTRPNGFKDCRSRQTDDQLILQFMTDEAAYRRLRDMLAADTNIREIRDSGVQMVDSPTFEIPPLPLLSAGKFNEYRELLRATGGIRAGRSEGPHPNICVQLQGGGWAGDAKHKDICWIEDASGRTDRFTRKLIEDHWYLEQDY